MNRANVTIVVLSCALVAVVIALGKQNGWVSNQAHSFITTSNSPLAASPTVTGLSQPKATLAESGAPDRGQPNKPPIEATVKGATSPKIVAETSPVNLSFSQSSAAISSESTNISEKSTVRLPYNTVHVLAVGVTNYSSAPGFSNLRYAEADARDVAHLFRSNFGFEVTVLLGIAATKEAILREFQSIANKLKPGDDFVLFFSLHGTTTNSLSDRYSRTGYLIPYGTTLARNASAEDLAKQAIDVKWLAKALTQTTGRHRVLAVDACFSGYAASTGMPREKIFDVNPSILDMPSVQVLTAGRENEEVVELSNIEEQIIMHGLFTHALLEVLRRDSSQSMLSLFLQVREHMLEMAGEKYKGRVSTPQHRLIIQTDGDFFFVPSRKQSNFLLSYTKQGDILNGKKGEYAVRVSEDEVARAQAAVPGENDSYWKGQINRFETRASMGDAAAAAALVHLYGRGVGVPADGRRAYSWARDGYDTEKPIGKYALGVALQQGFGVKADSIASGLLLRATGSDLLTRLRVPNVSQIISLPPGGGVIPVVGPPSVGEAAGIASFFINAFSRKGPPQAGNPQEDYGRRVQRKMEDRRKRLLARLRRPNPDWSGAEEEMNAWKNDISNLGLESTTNAGDEPLRLQLQQLQERLLAEVIELRSNIRDRTKNNCIKTLERIGRQLGTNNADTKGNPSQ